MRDVKPGDTLYCISDGTGTIGQLHIGTDGRKVFTGDAAATVDWLGNELRRLRQENTRLLYQDQNWIELTQQLIETTKALKVAEAKLLEVCHSKGEENERQIKLRCKCHADGCKQSLILEHENGCDTIAVETNGLLFLDLRETVRLRDWLNKHIEVMAGVVQ